MTAVELIDAREERRFGGKATSLGEALRRGFPVPNGWALSVELVDAIAAGDAEAQARVTAIFDELGEGPYAVRSSAVGEDSAQASFAGQHRTELNVGSPPAMIEAVRAVWRSGHAESALAYRRRLGIDGAPRVAVVAQRLVRPDCAGVLFTRNPVTGADERVVEVSWGLGEAVVAGLVTPDRVRMARGGAVLEHTVGEKDLEILATPTGGTIERAVDAARASAPCLGPDEVAALDDLAARCERAFDGASDIEFAFEAGHLHLLQRRAVTR